LKVNFYRLIIQIIPLLIQRYHSNLSTYKTATYQFISRKLVKKSCNMKTKKSLLADLESKRTNRFFMGLACAGALTLMSFEYRSYSIRYLDNIDLGVNTNFDEPFFEVSVEKPELPKFQTPEKPMPKEVSENIVVEERDPDDKTKENPVELNVGITQLIGEIGVNTFDEGDKGADIDNEIHQFPELNPEFPGGLPGLYDYLGSKIVYPEKARQNGIEGKVILQFIVEKDGSINDITIVKEAHSSLNNEALRVVGNMPKWKPGKQGNKHVRVRYTLPINFELGK
jgi:periplasmic protein TonB